MFGFKSKNIVLTYWLKMKYKYVFIIKTILLIMMFNILTSVYSPVFASNTLMERVDFTKITHEESVHDMTVKVLGGTVEVRRYYRVMSHDEEDLTFNVGLSGALRDEYRGNSLLAKTVKSFSDQLELSGTTSGTGGGSTGGAAHSIERPIFDIGVWQFHRRWHDLIFLGKEVNRENASGGLDVNVTYSPKYIDRNDYIYVKEPDQDYYQYRYNGADLRITKTSTGYRWSDRQGNWIDYNNDGKALASGDHNNVGITLVRNGDGLITQYKDQTGRVVLTWTYAGNRPVKVEDYTGRSVTYGWSDNVLTSVTTSRGDVWRYEYEEMDNGTGGTNKILNKKIDPEDQAFEYRYQMSTGGYQEVVSSSSSPDISVLGGEQIGVSTSSGGGGNRSSFAVSTAVPPTLTYTGKVFPDGKRIDYSYYYDANSQSYLVLDLNSDGFERERWFDLDGKINTNIKGGKIADTRSRSGSTAVLSDAYGNKTTINYTRFEAIASETLPDGATRSYEYLPNYNFPTLVTDELGVQTKHLYDGYGNRVRTIAGFESDDERVMEYDYDQYGQMTLVRYVGRTNPNGSSSETVEISYEYDSFGNIIKKTDGNGNTMRYQNYNAIGQSQTMIDGRGKTWQYTYDEHGNTLTARSPLGFITRYEYDSLHRLVKITDAEGRVIQNEYDSRDNLIKTTDNNGSVREMSYRMDGFILSHKDESGNLTNYRYDRAARLVEVTDGVGNQRLMTYEKGNELAGRRVESVTIPNGKIEYKYDQRNRVIERAIVGNKSDNLFSTTKVSYTARNEHQRVIDANGNTTNYIYNLHGELQSSTNAENETMSYEYDNRGNPIKLSDGVGHNIHYSYDKNNNRISETRPIESLDSATEYQFYAYDGRNNLIQITDYNGNIALYTFDDDSRVVQQSNTPSNEPVKDGTQADRVVTYTYDKTGLAKSYADQYSSASYQYDALGRLIEQTTQFVIPQNSEGETSFSKTLRTSYYDNSWIKSKTDAEQNLTSFTYDEAGKLVQMAIQNAGSIVINDYEGYLPKKITYPGGINRVYDYDGLARLNRIIVKDNANNLKMDYDYQFDAVGNITTKTIRVGTEAAKIFNYGYDDVYRLTSAEQPNHFGNQFYSYDNNSNRLTRTSNGGSEEQNYSYSYNEQQELVGVEQTIDNIINNSLLNYDANGALISNIDNSADPNSANNLSYDYNSYGRVQRINQGANPSVTEIGSYQYDTRGRRVSKTVNGETIYFLYDDTGAGLAGEYNQAGELIRGYGYQSNGMFMTDPMYLKIPKVLQDDQPLGYEFSFYQNDHLGTPQLLTQINGATVWQAEYDAFGQINETINLIEQPLRFAGQYHDKETNLYYNWHRYYSAELGRYISSDPIGIQGGSNFYGYVGGNPTVRIDINGLACISTTKTMSCSNDSPNGPTFALPAPNGFPERMDGLSHPGLYHSYSVSRDLRGADPDCVMREIIKVPTPGNPDPATPEGTPNNAYLVDERMDNQVTTYLTKDLVTGEPVVVNTAGSGPDDESFFGPGYTARYVRDGRVYTVGEGTSPIQSNYVTGLPFGIWGPVLGDAIQTAGNEYVWGGLMEEHIEACLCK